MPRGRLVILDGAQPTLFMEDPGMVVSMLVDFFCDGIEPAEVPPPDMPRAAAGHSSAAAAWPQP